ncbi:MAG: 23S rRNA (uracil(1939)-C(5))-methyltransferase RlmD [Candidatus Njordarchaeia archaeon]
MECQVEGLDKQGFGICKMRNKELIIQNAIPGETIKLEHLHGRIYLAREILTPSPHRVKPVCPHFNICGGCRWQHIDYNYQLKLKEETIRDLFNESNKIIKSPLKLGYRNKMEFTFGLTTSGLVLGLNKIARFDQVIDIDYCFLQTEEANDQFRKIKDFVKNLKLPPFNKRRKSGFLRYLTIREGFRTREIMVNIITTSTNHFPLEKLYKTLNVNSLIWTISDNPSDVAYGVVKEILGSDHITEKILGITFKISPFAFFQVNTMQAENMFKYLRERIEPGETALDLYSGIGTISLLISDLFNEIIGIEYLNEAVKMAEKNALINGIKNTRFIPRKVEQTLQKFWGKEIDTIIVDPPRMGIHLKALRNIIRIKPRNIIYVSCNPFNAKKDVDNLMKAGYEIREIQPFDMFPQTPHIETLIFLQKH